MTVYQRHKAMNVRDFRALVFRHHDGKFRELTNANVLIYWPHGFGDWVFFSYIVPLLEPTNRYWMTRFGDDTVSIMDGNEWVMPIYGGTNSTHCDDGGAFQNRHFGLDFDEIDGNEKPVSLPVSIYEACVQNKIDSVLFTDFPEPFGYSPFPFHSKPRNILRSLVRRKALEHVSLGRPLQSTINFSVPEWLTLWTESRLRNFCGFGQRKMCMIGRNGFTAIGKNWGHRWREEMPAGKRREGEECRDFMRLWLKKDPNWCFLILEERMFEGDNTVRDKELHAFSYAEIFGTVDASTIPFGLVGLRFFSSKMRSTPRAVAAKMA